MLLKNVYIIYPPGYGGTFINWCINASDIDSSKNTVKNPINTNISEKNGSSGTAHLHIKIPTHNGVLSQIAWILYNKPVGKQVYGCFPGSLINEIALIRQFDPEAIYIIIHHNNDFLQNSFGRINSIIKWPTHLSTLLAKENEIGRAFVHPTFDPYNCANDSEFRNWAVRTEGYYLLAQPPLDHIELKSTIDKQERWYRARNLAQPHEVNEKYYNTDFSYAHRIFEIDLGTLFSDKFIPWFDDFMKRSNVSTEFNIEEVKKIAPEYLKEQHTLKWFDSIEQWKRTGRFDNYITSHSIIEAEAIRYMLYLKPELDTTLSTGAPASDWDVLSAQELSDRHFTSDDFK